MATVAALVGVLFLGLFVVLVTLRYRQDQRRQAGWATEATRLGLATRPAILSASPSAWGSTMSRRRSAGGWTA